MNIAVIGATGKAGKQILEEASRRGHRTTAIVRDAAKAEALNADQVLEKNVFDLKAEDVRAFDAIVNAFGAAPGQEHQHVEAGRTLIEALKHVPATRLIVVGGAGSLFVDEAQTVRLLDTPDFPKAFYATASNQGRNLEDLQASSGVKWTFVSPSAFFDPDGPRTGEYRKGKDRLLTNRHGKSYVSYADFAIAVLDELEHPAHIGERFTVVSERS